VDSVPPRITEAPHALAGSRRVSALFPLTKASTRASMQVSQTSSQGQSPISLLVLKMFDKKKHTLFKLKT